MQSMTYKTDEQKFVFPYIYRDGIFSEPEFNKLLDYCHNEEKMFESQVPDGSEKQTESVVNKNIRNSNVRMFNPDTTNLWIFDRIKWCVETMNRDFYRYDLTGFNYLQYSEYRGEGAKYNYHMDMFVGTTAQPDWLFLQRKLSIVMLLSEPGVDYEGGDFEINLGGGPLIVPLVKGRIITFPSWVMHRVAPLTRGIRKSLVAWVLGPSFK